MSERPSRVWSWLALAAAILAVLLCLAAVALQHYALQLRPVWRGNQLADHWLRLLLWPTVAMAVVALMLRRTARGNWIGLVVTALALFSLVGAGIISYAHFYRLSQVRGMSCLSNVKNVATALYMYESDYSAFPPAEAWQDALPEYVRADLVYQCPQVPEAKSAQAMNSQVAGLGRAGIGNPGRLVSVFESDQGWNASGGPELLPTYPRHGATGDNYGFADGHAKWYLRPRADGQATSEPRWLKVPPNESTTWQPKPAGGEGQQE